VSDQLYNRRAIICIVSSVFWGRLKKGPLHTSVFVIATGAGRVGKKFAFSANIWLHRVLWTVRAPSTIHSAATDYCKVMTLVAGKRQSLLMAEDDDNVFMTRSLNVTPKTTELHLIVRLQWLIWSLSNNNERLRSRYYTAEANYWRTRSLARPLCNSRATYLKTFIRLVI